VDEIICTKASINIEGVLDDVADKKSTEQNKAVGEQLIYL
jgi:hypothetical protein